jgi:3-hydroxymyristoyl/3-hydroxydecanoyl-(acyl carrier protein) dehydratase
MSAPTGPFRPGEDPLARLPHGPEFRFLDRILELEGGRRGVGIFRLRGDEPFLRAHFPGDPVMPGVLLVEAGAQLAGAVAQSDPLEAPLRRLRLAGIRRAKFKGAVRPGDTIRIVAEVVSRLGGLILAEAQAWVGDQSIMEAEITLAGD